MRVRIGAGWYGVRADGYSHGTNKHPNRYADKHANIDANEHTDCDANEDTS